MLAELPPRQELIVRMALNGRSKNLGPDWDRRVTVLMRECKIDGTAKIAKLLTAVRKQGKVTEEWAEGDGHSGRTPLTFAGRLGEAG